MRRKLFLSSAIFSILLVSTFAIAVEATSTTWSQTYGGEDTDSAESVIQTSDGGYAIAGRTKTGDNGVSSFWLVKTDEFGNMEWNKAYGGENLDIAYSLVATSDGGYAIGGMTYSFGAGSSDFWLIKADEDGTVEWNQTYGGTGYDAPRSLIVSSDMGYVIVGGALLVKTDAFGNIEWNRTYGGSCMAVVETSNESYTIAGYTTTVTDFWLVKIDASGTIKWNQTYAEKYDDHATSLVATSDGGYAIAGYTKSFDENNDFWLVKTDEFGNTQWNQSYRGAGDDRAEALIESSDGGFMLAGVKDAVRHPWDGHPIGGNFWLVKTDASGNVEWNRTYGGDSVAWASSVIETSDGGYAIAGEKDGDFWLIKTDEYGIVAELCPPYICVGSPQNMTYNTANVSLTFTVNEETTWMGYSLDGQTNVTITENTVNLTALAEGSHILTVYAKDKEGNTGTSETISFTIKTQLTWTTIALVAAIVSVVSIAAIRWYLKNKHTQKNVK